MGADTYLVGHDGIFYKGTIYTGDNQIWYRRISFWIIINRWFVILTDNLYYELFSFTV